MLATTNQQTSITVIEPGNLEAIARVVCDSVDSENTKRAYRRAIRDFHHLAHGEGQP